jgi:predicted adenylyl cyclase CyaB
VIEAELKARVHDAGALRDRLRRLAAEETSLYRDTYYDRPGRDLIAQGRELRVRVMETSGVRRAVLTYKEPAADVASGSKPEHETTVADAAVIDEILSALGLEHLVAFEKHCANYRVSSPAVSVSSARWAPVADRGFPSPRRRRMASRPRFGERGRDADVLHAARLTALAMTASRMTPATMSGCDLMRKWEAPSTSVTVEPARS